MDIQIHITEKHEKWMKKYGRDFVEIAINQEACMQIADLTEHQLKKHLPMSECCGLEMIGCDGEIICVKCGKSNDD